MVKYKTVFFIKSLQDESILVDNIEAADIQSELTRINTAMEFTQKNLGRIVYSLSSKNIIIEEESNEPNNSI
jgi:hypothetical protein